MKRLALIAIGLFFFQCTTQAAVPAIDSCIDEWYGVTCDEYENKNEHFSCRDVTGAS